MKSRTGINDQKVLSLVRIDMADTGEEEACDGILVANGGHEGALLMQ